MMVYPKRYNFLNIDNSVLKSKNGDSENDDIAVSGDVSLITGFGGAKFAEFTQEGQSLNFSQIELLNPEACSIGFTLRFIVKLTSVCENGYILRNWQANEAGLSISTCGGQPTVSVRTENKEWFVQAGSVTLDK